MREQRKTALRLTFSLVWYSSVFWLKKVAVLLIGRAAVFLNVRPHITNNSGARVSCFKWETALFMITAGDNGTVQR